MRKKISLPQTELSIGAQQELNDVKEKQNYDKLLQKLQGLDLSKVNDNVELKENKNLLRDAIIATMEYLSLNDKWDKGYKDWFTDKDLTDLIENGSGSSRPHLMRLMLINLRQR